MNTFLLGKAIAHSAMESTAKRAAVLRRQELRLRRILKHAFVHSAFYSRHYRSAGIRERDLDRIPLRDLPTIDKTTMMDNFDELVCDPKLRREDLEHFVAGPSTRGMKYLDRYAVVSSSGSSGTIGLHVYGPQGWAGDGEKP